MSATASSSKPVDTAPKGSDLKKDEDSTLHLGVLEEDDEFEEFAAADWDDSQTHLAQLGGSADQPGGDKLWEDNWDDDDIEDEFSVQLRHELEKTGKAGAAGEAMEH
ncbi:hypothetical protein HGRIS_003541 [Hohenbuehelia grisea]|uniref:26S proteasome complex subunit SEM1 n=1 Tax=Hohenbuehelia grisea TaxID=104357 RepID=A0ABR3JHC0_9AGAR